MTAGGRPRLALVVPGLAGEGGVTAVARFIRDVVFRSGRLDLRVVSLSESARDPVTLRLTAPRSWVHGPGVKSGEWEGVPYVHVGAVAGELEFQRYRPRAILSRLLDDCDVIQVICGSPAWGNAVLGLGPPVSLHVATRARIERRLRDGRLRSPAALWRRAMTEVTDRMDDRALRAADAVQVMNPWMLEYVRTVNAGRPVDLRYLPPGVDSHVFCPRPPGNPPDTRSILCVGRFGDPRKHVALLLDAYAQLPETLRQDVQLVLAGSTPPPSAFWRRAQRLGVHDRITYIDHPDAGALLTLFQSATVFALPSDEEGFGMVVLEAMACGVPVVSTRSGGPDGIITDAHDGFLVARDDAQGLSSRLAFVLQTPAVAREIGRQARLTIERRYDVRVAGEAFVDVWDRLVARGRTAAV